GRGERGAAHTAAPQRVVYPPQPVGIRGTSDGDQVGLLSTADRRSTRREGRDGVVAWIRQVAPFVERSHAQNVIGNAAVVERLCARTVVTRWFCAEASVLGERCVFGAAVNVVVDRDVGDAVAVA